MPDPEKLTDALRALRHKVEAWWPGDAGMCANTLKEEIDAILARCGEEEMVREAQEAIRHVEVSRDLARWQYEDAAAQRDRLLRAVGQLYELALAADGVFGKPLGQQAEIAEQIGLTDDDIQAAIQAAKEET